MAVPPKSTNPSPPAAVDYRADGHPAGENQLAVTGDADEARDRSARMDTGSRLRAALNGHTLDDIRTNGRHGTIGTRQSEGDETTAADDRAAGRPGENILKAAAQDDRAAGNANSTSSSPPLLTIVSLAVPPEKTASQPPLSTVVSMTVPPERSILKAAAQDGRADGRAAGLHVKGHAGADDVVADNGARPIESVPPALMVKPLAMPPNRSRAPPLSTIVPLATPPALTVSVPP